MTKREAEQLSKTWRLGNRFRRKSLVKKHSLLSAISRNTGKVKIGIKLDVEKTPQEYIAALDSKDDLIFFTGKPMKQLSHTDLFTPPKAPKKRERVPAKPRENTMINHKLEMLKTLFPNKETTVLEKYLKANPFELNEFSVFDTKTNLKAWISENTQFQLVAIKKDGSELKSNWYEDENELSDMQQKCEENDEYESTSVLKRVVNIDEDEEDDVDYTDGAEQEAEQEFPQEEEEQVDESDVEMLKLTTLALKQIPGSPKQRETIKKLNILRKKAGQKPLKEKEIDINDEISESKVLTGYVKKNRKAKKLVDLIMKKKNAKDIGKEFKKLSTKEKESFMNALGDVEDETLLQRGNVVKQLIAMYDEVTPNLDGRSKAFKEKLRKLEYNKKKKLPYDVFEGLDEQPIHNDNKKSILRHQELAVQAHKKGDREAVKFHQDKIRKLRMQKEEDEIEEKKLAGLQKKADKTGIPYGILKQVFNRGVAAWRTGHRPGTNPTQWGYARVNSFATKSKGTWGGADKDLAAKVRAKG